ncbi:MAG TPA: hypothetical protein VKB52_12340 [Rhodanobacteraceae bacterium]|nr:hypothetical protein [Rhodanobacteraceae bacterium]
MSLAPFRVRLAAAFALFVVTVAQAAVDPAQFADLSWRLIGPFRGGRVLAVAGVPGEPQHFYFGAVNGGVWETKDAGRTWQPIFDDVAVGSIGAIAIAPSAHDTIYVGTGEADMRSDIAQGDGVYKSTDGGRTWKHAGLADSQQIGRVIVDPHDANLVFVASLGHPYGPNGERGVFRSKDGGATWQRVLGNDDATGAIDLAFEPGNPRVVYAAMWQARRTPWNIYPPASGPGSALYKSSDGGDTWTKLGNGFPSDVGRIGIAVAPSDPKRVYAIVDGRTIAGDAGGLYRSGDAGASWRRTSNDDRVWQRGWYFGRITVDPKNAERLYAMNTIVLRSDDGGAHFVADKGDNTGDDFHELWIDGDDADRQILGVDQGAIVTLNGGRTWSSWHNQPTAQIYHVSTDNRFPYRVYGAQQDSGAAALPSRTGEADGITMRAFHEVTAGGEADMIAPDPDDPDIVYGGRVDRLDLKSGQTRSVDPTLATPDLWRRTWTLPLVFSKTDPKRLYFGSQKLFRTTDGGQHWDTISPDLTREDPGVPPNVDAVTADNNERQGPRRGVIYAIAPSPLDKDLLWIGTDDGLVWKSRDDGAHWDDVTPHALTPWSKVGIVEASHFDAATAYLAIDRHRLDDRKPYVYRTHDGGASWELVVDGIRDGDFVNAVREDPQRKDLLYAATELGMYVSFDDGTHWQTLQANLPRTSVRDIDVHGDDLVIATHGRGFWIMDGIAPLRELAAAPERKDTRLFAPSTAIRARVAAFTGTPLPKDEPIANNPPAGAMIDYVLEKPAREVALAIYDKDNRLVRRYASSDPAPARDPAKAAHAIEWMPRPLRLATTEGMHRFVWPLRYAKPKALADTDTDIDGVFAPPGNYSIELDVDGRKLRQPLTVAPDPRIAMTDAAYAEQAKFAQAIEAAQVRIATAAEDAKKLHKALGEARGVDASGATLVAAIDAFDADVVARAGIVEAGNPHNGWALPPATTTSLRFIGETLGKLAAAADGADAAPTPDARAGYTATMELTETALGEWKGVTGAKLDALNAQLKAAHRAAISLEAKPARK